MAAGRPVEALADLDPEEVRAGSCRSLGTRFSPEPARGKSRLPWTRLIRVVSMDAKDLHLIPPCRYCLVMPCPASLMMPLLVWFHS